MLIYCTIVKTQHKTIYLGTCGSTQCARENLSGLREKPINNLASTLPLTQEQNRLLHYVQANHTMHKLMNAYMIVYHSNASTKMRHK